MALHLCGRACVLLVLVMTSVCLKPRRAACYGGKLSPGDIVKNVGDNAKEYQVLTCLGRGGYGEVWTLNGTDHLLKLEHPPRFRASSECLFGRIAKQKDPAHFTNCFDHGPAEVWTAKWTLKGSNLVLKYEWKGGYSVWQRAGGTQVAALHRSYDIKGFEKVFADLHSVLAHLNQLFHMFDALQRPGTTAPGIGVRQWHTDASPRNTFASADGLMLIDYGIATQCCDDPGNCAVDSGFEDVKIETCESLVGHLPRLNFEHADQMIGFFLNVALPHRSIGFDWLKHIHNTSLESLVMGLQSSSGPSQECFRDQWGLQHAKVILAMASMVHKKDGQWPPLFMEPVRIALESVTLDPPIMQELVILSNTSMHEL